MIFKRQDYAQWHRWFAWFPIAVGWEIVWWETVERRGEYLGWDVTNWDYRRIAASQGARR